MNGYKLAPELGNIEDDDDPALAFDGKLDAHRSYGWDPFHYPKKLFEDGLVSSPPLPSWMEQDLGLDKEFKTRAGFAASFSAEADADTGDPSSSSSSSLPSQRPSNLNTSNDTTSATQQQVTQMAFTIGDQFSEIERLRFELDRTKSQLDVMEKQQRHLLFKPFRIDTASTPYRSDLLASNSSGSGSSSSSLYRSEPNSASWKNVLNTHTRASSPLKGFGPGLPSPTERNIWNCSPAFDTKEVNTRPPKNTTVQPVPHVPELKGQTSDVPVLGLEKDKTEVYYPIREYNEALNYRKLLERSVSCNWKFIVDRIVLDNDQQASIFLQQKLKVANSDQKNGIISAIIGQSYMLMINRFGNFLVQRCLEYGSPEQIAAITRGVLGNVVDLAMDPFGCHVIQKALDCVGGDMKTAIVEEMLNSVTSTVVHRYACHVWQKLFELRWDTTPQQKFMQQVNKNLAGMWTQVALGETGSLVVQNIFENCTEHDKRPCVEEVVENMGTVIRGQWGNWVIQHMVEHASEPYRHMVCQHIIHRSPDYSVDQFASKVVEKMLKMGDPAIIQGFLDKVTEPIPDRPRIPLIDIASDAHGNYLIQYVLQSQSQAQKDQVATQLKKHMVSLRGSKWGSKCAWLIDKNTRRKK